MNVTDGDPHKRMTERRKAGFERKQARATLEKGLLIVITGPGKGKTTSAFGMALRALAHGMKLGIVQFIKGAQATGERDLLQSFPGVHWLTVGDGFTWITQNRERDVTSAQRGWEQARELLSNPDYRMVILDELNTILHYQYLDPGVVLAAIAARDPMQHVIVTGRNAPPALVDAADLVSDIHVVKHPYRDQGVKAQPGIEF